MEHPTALTTAPRRATPWALLRWAVCDTRSGVVAALLAALTCWAFGTGSAWAQEAPAGLPSGVTQQIEQLAREGSAHAGVPGIRRVEVKIGTLDPRLRLAPCQRIEPFLPPNARLWGATRVGLRCVEGATRWSIFIPMTVRVIGPALVAAAPLAAGTVLTDADLAPAEVDWAEDPSATFQLTELAVGRTLARAVNAGQALRQSHLRARQWFAAGDVVKVMARGDGFAVAGSAQALTHGIEGQPARVRTESGQVLTGLPVADRQVELSM
jgi:flagella basal body P-ring formation protein FlgA